MPIFPDIQMNLVRPASPVVGRVVSNESCLGGKSASFVRHTVIDVSGTPLAGSFAAGQSFGVIAPGVNQQGNPHKVRLYSVACPAWGEDGAGQVLSTTPKRLVDEYLPRDDSDPVRAHSLFLGLCSNYLCDLQPGDEVLLTGPQGKRFLLPEDREQHDYLFVATGTGIAPFRGMLLELLEHPEGPTRSRVDLIMGVPYTTDLLYHEFFSRLEREHDNFHYHQAISREADSLYVGGLIEKRMKSFESLLHNERTLLYLCGLEGMRKGVFDVLIRHGMADGYLVEKGGRLKPGPRAMVEVY